MKILLFEKNDDDRQNIIETFYKAWQNIDIDVVESNQKAIELLQKSHYDCVYIGEDLLTPLNGNNLIQQAQDLGVSSPFVVLLSHKDKKDSIQMTTSGIQGYLSKHQITPAMAAASLNNILNSSNNKERNESTHLKQVFLTDMGHELRTPMSAILGFSSLLMQSQLDESQYKFARSIYEATDSLLTIINDILDYSKIEAGKLNIDRVDFDLRELLYKVKQRFEHSVAQKHLNLSLHIDEQLPNFLKSDSKRIEQILVHLMNNAIKFTPKGDVELHARLLSYKEKLVHIQFEIKDTGIGISKEKLNLIFDSFAHTDSRHYQRFGGAGLGLIIVKKLIDLLGGKITVQSNEGEGTRFICNFAFPVGQVTQEFNKKIDGTELENIHVLVCEDNILSQELTKEILHRLGCKVDIAENGKVGVDKLQKKDRHYDIVLMDIQMPEMDGIEATSSIRVLPHEAKDIPIIALTAQNVTDEKEKYFEAGMTDYLTKPFTPYDITQKVLKHLPRKVVDVNKGGQGTASPANADSSSHTLFDLDFLKDAFGDNPVIFQELLQLLTNQFLKFKEEVSNGLYLKDWKMIEHAARIIKTNLRAFGLKSLENKVTLIEEYAGKHEDLNTIPALVRDCEDIFAGAIKELNSLLGDENITQGKHLYRNS